MFYGLCICMSCAIMDEPIEMPFGVRTWLGPRNHVIGGGLDPPGEGGM